MTGAPKCARPPEALGASPRGGRGAVPRSGGRDEGLHHPDPALLLDWWLHDTDDATTDAVDAHLMRCEPCGAALDTLLGLSEGVRRAWRAGEVAAVLDAGFVEHLRAQGLRMHEVKLAHNGNAQCMVSPEDELLLARLAAPLQGVQRLDLVAEFSFAPGVPQRLHDVPFDATAGELLFAPGLSPLRSHPAHAMVLRLLAVTPNSGERLLGRYSLRHQPWLEPPVSS
jgi:hypothetical protein